MQGGPLSLARIDESVCTTQKPTLAHGLELMEETSVPPTDDM